jgi:hypothetical protein
VSGPVYVAGEFEALKQRILSALGAPRDASRQREFVSP